MGKHLQAEPLGDKPEDFDPWADELGWFTDVEGTQALLGVVMEYAPTECVRALASDQRLWACLMARGRFADRKRFELGVQIGKLVGV